MGLILVLGTLAVFLAFSYTPNHENAKVATPANSVISFLSLLFIGSIFLTTVSKIYAIFGQVNLLSITSVIYCLIFILITGSTKQLWLNQANDAQTTLFSIVATNIYLVWIAVDLIDAISYPLSKTEKESK